MMCGQVQAQEGPEFKTFTYGTTKQYEISLRALLEQEPKVLEMKLCFPRNRWFGVGFGGKEMFSSELVFFMAPNNKDMQRVVATRMTT
jgi:hypothetical protein